MLYYNTIDGELLKALKDLCKIPELSNFTLVGGTALSLQLGHRKSDDLDFFTERSFDVKEIKNVLCSYNPNIVFLSQNNIGTSFSLPLKQNDYRKIDLYNWAVPFIGTIKKMDGIRLAGLEDIAALKLDAICFRKEKKDYIDIAVLLNQFSFEQLLGFYEKKFPMNDKRNVMVSILDTNEIENSANPNMLFDLNIGQAIKQIEKAVTVYSEAQIQKREKKEQQQIDRLKKIAARKHNHGSTPGEEQNNNGKGRLHL